MSILLVQMDDHKLEEVRQWIHANYTKAQVKTISHQDEVDWHQSELIIDAHEIEEVTAPEDILQQIKEYIQQHCSQSLTLTQVAEQIHFTPVYFGQWFKQKTGIGFKEYILQIRLQQMKYWLLNSSYTIDWIAAHVGYQDATYISKTFARVYGLSPGAYRKQYRLI
ncbi:helix-turn-helix transcriptional regulator [Paenibacillus sp. WLX1005]|uniref:helix-turn-helix transcriptional regulator n=1 Tax=Paenibacillus sp. WLX1005 TaxID=3243766 RepID=UPI0039844ABF